MKIKIEFKDENVTVIEDVQKISIDTSLIVSTNKRSDEFDRNKIGFIIITGLEVKK